MPIATFALLVCTKIDTLVMHNVSPVPHALDFVEDCLSLDPDDPNNTHIPLASLKKFDLRYPPLPREPGPEHDDREQLKAGYESKGSDWLSWFIRLPQLESITLHRLPERPWRFQARSPGPKRLTLTDRRAPTVRTHELEDVLKACPLLEHLDATWTFGSAHRSYMEWAELGAAVTRHGSSLRKLTINYYRRGGGLSSDGPPTQTNLASLSHLRELTLPVEALLPETPKVWSPPEFDEFDPEYYDEGLRAASVLSDLQASQRAVGLPPVSLCRLLPHSLQHLIIIDDFYLWADAVRLDEELRNLMLDPQFSELRVIRVRRRIPWSEHVKDLGWHEERYGRYWNALLRPGSLSDSDA
jgi:hypothetical protein